MTDPIEPLYTDEEIEAARVLFAQPVSFMMGAVRMDGLPPADPALAGGDTTGPAERSSSSLTWDSVAPQGSASSALLGGDPLAERAIMIAGLFVVVVLGLVIAIAA